MALPVIMPLSDSLSKDLGVISGASARFGFASKVRLLMGRIVMCTHSRDVIDASTVEPGAEELPRSHIRLCDILCMTIREVEDGNTVDFIDLVTSRKCARDQT